MKKRKEKDEKVRIRENRKMKEKSYFEWPKKHENIEEKGGEIKYARWR